MYKACLATLLLLSGSAHAALIDNGSFTTDSSNSIDWLDLSTTQGMSVETALSTQVGWRLATNTEIESLFYQAFDGFYATSSNGASYSSGDEYADQQEDAINFISLFGVTFGNNTQQSKGLYLDEDSSWRTIGAGNDIRPEVETHVVFGLEYNTNDELKALSGNTGHGVYLVRSSIVPIPAAVWLFASGLGLLGWFRRKYHA